MVKTWKRKKGNSKFNPGSKYIEKSVRNFLKEGGKIEQLEASIVSLEHDKALVDAFLMGNNDNN